MTNYALWAGGIKGKVSMVVRDIFCVLVMGRKCGEGLIFVH
jgi:hypothetical protein